MKVLIVDDEAPARRTLERAVASFEGAECAGSVASGSEARRWFAAGGIDVVLLDVQMPEVSGIDLVRSTPLEILPLVIFVTAFDRYAIEAFDSGAIDYVLKPVEPARIRRALERAAESIRLRTARKTVARLLQVLATSSEPLERAAAPVGAADALALPTDGGLVRVTPASVTRVDASGATCEVHVGGDVHEVRRSLADLERQLAPLGRHLRIHRSHLVAVSVIERLERKDGGTGDLTLVGGATLPVSRQRMKAVCDRLGWT